MKLNDVRTVSDEQANTIIALDEASLEDINGGIIEPPICPPPFPPICWPPIPKPCFPIPLPWLPLKII
jgi:hypothetical protein